MFDGVLRRSFATTTFSKSRMHSMIEDRERLSRGRPKMFGVLCMCQGLTKPGTEKLFESTHAWLWGFPCGGPSLYSGAARLGWQVMKDEERALSIARHAFDDAVGFNLGRGPSDPGSPGGPGGIAWMLRMYKSRWWLTSFFSFSLVSPYNF